MQTHSFQTDDEKFFKQYTYEYTFKAANTWEYSGFSFSFNYAYIFFVSTYWLTAKSIGVAVANSSISITDNILSQIEANIGPVIKHMSFVTNGNPIYFWYKSTNIGKMRTYNYVLPISISY